MHPSKSPAAAASPTYEETVAKLRQRALSHILRDHDFGRLLDQVANDISCAAREAANEATVVSQFEVNLYHLLRQVTDVKFQIEKEVRTEVATKRHVVYGRMDSRIGALVIEYKHHTKLYTEEQKLKAKNQLLGYLQSTQRERVGSVVGILTDGVQAQVIQIDDDQEVSAGAFEPLGRTHLEQIIRSAILLQQAALTPANLVKDFCDPSTKVATTLAKVLFEAVANKITQRTEMLFSEWNVLFHLAHDDVSKQSAIRQRRLALANALGISITPDDNRSEYMALYALQTAYAIIVKCIALRVIGAICKDNPPRFSELAKSSSEALRLQMNRLEAGDVFSDLGYGNLLEGDFFAWYCTEEQWNSDISRAVQEVLRVLSHYESQPFISNPRAACDFFKDLYLHVMPDEVRHSLGEFYTPPWLADHVVQRAVELGGVNNWRGLDPCCGSGTFLTNLLRRKLEATVGMPRRDRLRAILDSVVGIDLNPLAVLTARINYFINITSLIEEDTGFEIPVYLGDASYVPKSCSLGEIECVQYQIRTLRGPIDIVIPRSALRDIDVFSNTMTALEIHIKNEDTYAIAAELLEICSSEDRTDAVVTSINSLATKLVDLETDGWNGIWARIVSNFLTTSALRPFDIIVGNPPWIDWRNLPSNYRDGIKNLCLDRRLFSGDGITGGINLNICALITSVALDTWLGRSGVLAFLMPDALIYQKTYEGFRRLQLQSGESAHFVELHDWSGAGNPFAPVTQPFFTYFISRDAAKTTGTLPVKIYAKKRNSIPDNIRPLTHFRMEALFSRVAHVFKMEERIASRACTNSTGYSIVSDTHEEQVFKSIAGTCEYLGRQGLEFIPQELFLFSFIKSAPAGRAHFRNFQGRKSKHSVPQQNRIFETKLLHPLVKGKDISRFRLTPPELVAPFPYEEGSRSPMDRRSLGKASKNLLEYFYDHKSVFATQSDYNAKIIGEKHNTEFYAVTRVGEYVYADNFVAFRDNTKWGAVVVTQLSTPWGERKRPVFQKHAVAISQDANGRFISYDEAHYVCAILNAPSVAKLIYASSDERTFKIRPQIFIPSFDEENILHRILADTSKFAHRFVDNPTLMAGVDRRLDAVYSMMLNNRAS